MIYATVEYKGKEHIACIDEAGSRAFLLDDFFRDAEEFLEISNIGDKLPESLIDFILAYDPQWGDDIPLFFGSQPDLALPLNEVKLLAPIPEARRNLVCLGKNYLEHVKEIKGITGGGTTAPPLPIYFTKATHTVIGTKEPILAHEDVTNKLDYEVELAIIIGKAGINISKEDAEEYIFGYTIANDISARDLQTGHIQWFKGKSLISHCPMGPWIVHKSLLPLPLELSIKSYVNGDLRQDGNTRDMIFDIPTIISDLSRGYQLLPGDIILTGTPAGVGMGFDPPRFLNSGDQIGCQIEGIGEILNDVK